MSAALPVFTETEGELGIFASGKVSVEANYEVKKSGAAADECAKIIHPALLIHTQQAVFNYLPIAAAIDLTAIASNITHVTDLSTP